MKRFVLVAALLVAAAPDAQAQRIAVGPSVSTLGFGVEVPIKLNRHFVARIGGNYFSTSMSRVLDGIEYGVDLDLSSVGASLDFHPFRNGLMLSAGYFWNGNELSLSATPAADTIIGGQTFTPAEIGSLNGKVDFGKFSPFLGIGYDSTFYTDWRLSLVIRAGVLIMGDSTVSLSTTGAGAASLATNLEAEERELENSLNDIGLYPVITIGLRYRF